MKAGISKGAKVPDGPIINWDSSTPLLIRTFPWICWIQPSSGSVCCRQDHESHLLTTT